MSEVIDWVVNDVEWQYTWFIFWVAIEHIILLPFSDIESCILCNWILQKIYCNIFLTIIMSRNSFKFSPFFSPFPAQRMNTWYMLMCFYSRHVNLTDTLWVSKNWCLSQNPTNTCIKLREKVKTWNSSKASKSACLGWFVVQMRWQWFLTANQLRNVIIKHLQY